MKRVLSFILVLSMVLGSMGMAFAAPTGNTAIDKMVELGFVKGDEGTGDLRLNDTIKRSEVAAIVTRVLGLEGLANSSNYQGRFTDVTPAHWANGSVNVAAGKSLVKGYENGTFLPEGNITNNEAVTIMVRMLLSAEEIEKVEKAGVWPSNYLVKAAELGILDGVSIANYGEAATRETVFSIAYNAYETIAEEDLHVVKAIVLENERVERLGKNEVVVEVLKEVVKADFVTESRKDKDAGAQLRITLPEGFDAEDLLGKVVDIAFDKADAIVRITEDTNYTVLTGAITAEAKKLTIGGKTYTVSLDERYDAKDDRVYRTYYNNKAVAYKDFYQGLVEKDAKRADEFKADYARVTIHNGKVALIDAYQFEDIAPVKEVKEDGAEVFVYNDARDGGVKKFELKATTNVTTVKDGVFAKATMADIKANDVVHYYGNGFIVRKDAAVNGTFEKVSENRDGHVFVNVDGKEYRILDTANKRPVYSYDSEDFYTLNADAADKVLKEFRGEKVTVLQDLSGRLQYIGSEIELGEFVGIVTKVVGKEIRVLKADGKTADYTATLDTKVVVDGASTGHKNLNALDAGDLVYLSVDGENIDKVIVLTQEYKNKTKTVGEAKAQEVTSFDAKDIELLNVVAANDEKDFRILSNTTIFVKTANGYEVRTAKDVKDAFEKNQKDSKTVKAYVISGERFDYVADPRRDVYTTRATEAHTIVFTEIEIKSDLDTKIVEFNGYADRQEKEMKVIYADGSKETLTVDRGSKVPAGLKGGDILEIAVTKDDKKVIETVSSLITAADKDEVFGVVEYDRQGNLTLKDVNKEEKTFYVYGKTEVFGGVLEDAKLVSYVLDNNSKYVKAILIKDAKKHSVTGTFSGQINPTEGTVTAAVYAVSGDKVTFDVKVDENGTAVTKETLKELNLTNTTVLFENTTTIYESKLAIRAYLISEIKSANQFTIEYTKDGNIVTIVKK